MLQKDDHTCGTSIFDCWTDQYARRSYIAHIYHYVNQNFELQSGTMRACLARFRFVDRRKAIMFVCCNVLVANILALCLSFFKKHFDV